MSFTDVHSLFSVSFNRAGKSRDMGMDSFPEIGPADARPSAAEGVLAKMKGRSTNETVRCRAARHLGAA